MNIESLNYAYDLDCGGYSWEDCPEIGDCVVVWDDPDTDYFPCDFPRAEFGFVAFAPNTGHFPEFDFPEVVTISGTVYRKHSEGRMNGTDHDCHCHGVMVPHHGAAGQYRDPLSGADVSRYIGEGVAVVDAEPGDALTFEHTGNTMDAPFPDCPRCEGYGYVDSVGGEFANYVECDDDDDDDDDDGPINRFGALE